MLGFKPALALSSFTFIKRLFSSSSLSTTNVISSAYLRLLIFLEILIPGKACALSIATFHVKYSAYQLNKQGDTMKPWHTFPILNQSIVPCLVQTVASWPAQRFLRRQARWSGIPISFRIFQFVVIHIVKGFHVVNGAEVYAFFEFPWYFLIQRMLAVWSLASAFFKPSLYIWKFLVHMLLKPSLNNFEHYLANMSGSLNGLWHCPSLGLE